MERLLKWLARLFLGLFLVGLIAPIYINWLTTVLTPDLLAAWVYRRIDSWHKLYDTNQTAFQVVTLHVVIVPLTVLCLVVGAVCQSLVALFRRQQGVREQLQQVERDLSPLMLIYDLRDYDFMGRLRRLASRFDLRKFEELRRLVYETVYEFCGPAEDEKETFLVVIPAEGEGFAYRSVVNEQVSEALYENLLSIRCCELAMQQQTLQHIPAVRRDRNMTVTANGWVLPDCQSILVCPVVVGKEACGVIGVYHSQENAFRADIDGRLLEMMASILSLAYTLRPREEE